MDDLPDSGYASKVSPARKILHMSDERRAAQAGSLLLPAKRNARQRMNGYDLLKSVRDGGAKLVFCDPQYRAVLDKMAYGNEGARQKGRASLPQMPEAQIGRFLRQIERILAPSGHLVLWTDKFAIGTGWHVSVLRHLQELQLVDLICWNKLRPGMGRRARCVSEYAVIVQKNPIRAKGIWTDRAIWDCWPEMADRGRHPHAKPHLLMERLIRATTKRGDLVVDPCAGGYGVLAACELSGREFLGCDLAT